MSARPGAAPVSHGRLREVLAAGKTYFEKGLPTGAPPVPPEVAYENDKEGYFAHLDECVKLHNFLRDNGVPKFPGCGIEHQGRVQRGTPKSVECSADGYKMVIDMQAYADKVFDTAAVAEVEKAKTLASPLEYFGWAIIPTEKSFEERVAFVQQLSRAQELLSPYTTLCQYGDDRQILVEIFEDVSRKRSVRIIQPRNPLEIAGDEFTHELLNTSEFVYFHPTQPGFVWLHRVTSPEQANVLHLPWPPPRGEKEYMYLPLICSDSGGGTALMLLVAKAMACLGIKTLVLSALPHVVWYYYKVYGARFVNMRMQQVNVEAYAGKNPLIQPYSEAQADVKKLLFGPRSTRDYKRARV